MTSPEAGGTEPAVRRGDTDDPGPGGPVGPAADPLEPEDAVARVTEACHDSLRGVWDRLEERLEEAVRSAVRRAGEAHALLRVPDASRGAEDPAAESELEAYRRGMLVEVLGPLAEALERASPSRIVSEVFEEVWRESIRASDHLPRSAVVRWGAGALDPTPSDGLGRRLRKRWARWFGAARKADRDRSAPLRAVALDHMEARGRPLVDASAVAASRAWAEWVGRLELACADWADEALPALAEAGRGRTGERAATGEGVTGPTPSHGARPAEPGAADEASASSENGGDAPHAEDGGEATSSTRPGADSLTGVAAAAERLGAALTELASAVPHTDARAVAEAELARAAGALSSDLRAAGCFVYRPRPIALRELDLPGLARARTALASWEEQAAARLSLQCAYLTVLVGGAAVRRRLAEHARSTALDPLEPFGEEADLLTSLAREAERAGPPRREGLERIRASAEAVVRSAVGRAPDPGSLSRTLDAIVAETIDALQAIVRQAPTKLALHPRDARTPETLRPSEERVVPFQDLAAQALDALRVERIRAATLEVARAYGPVQAGLVELPAVIAFAFDAAAKELLALEDRASEGPGAERPGAEQPGAEQPGAEQSGRDAEEGPGGRATRLAVEALERSAGVLREAPGRVESVLETSAARVAGELSDGALVLLDRIGAGRVQAQLMRARSRFAAWRMRSWDWVRPALRRLRRLARLYWLRLLRSERRILGRLKAVLGEGPTQVARGERTVRAFARGDSGPGHVPLVYQRLFSRDAVDDASFLVGRTSELGEVLKRWRRWKEEDEVPLLVMGSPGSGVTSFLTVTAATLRSEGADVRWIDLPERALDERTLVARLAGVFGCEEVGTLEGLATWMLGRSPGGLPDVAVLDGLEQLYLRVPGGTDLVERFLTFMSETEPRVFWMVGVGQSAWKLIAKAEPIAVAQVDTLEVGPLPVERLRETVLQRHRRSGLRLTFAEPREGRALLRRRLRRLRGTEGHQRLLEQDFFDQLHKVSLGDLKLALFHWMLAADFDAVEGEVLMNPPVRPDFAVLDTLGQPQNFTLKALLEHRTLTLAEHDAVFGVTHQESYQIFESLQNRLLIEELDGRPAWEHRDSEIHRASRYRIRPLLSGAVAAHLRALNVLH